MGPPIGPYVSGHTLQAYPKFAAGDDFFAGRGQWKTKLTHCKYCKY